MKQIQQWICSDNLHHLHHLQQPLLGRQKSFVEIWVAKLLISVCWPWCWRRQCEKKMSRASVSEWSVGFCLKKRYDNAYIYVHIRTYRISRSKRTDDTSSITWQAEKYVLKGFFEGWILVARVSVSRNFQDQEKMEEAETVHRQALQAGKQSPFPVFRVSWFGMFMAPCFIILYGCLWYLFFEHIFQHTPKTQRNTHGRRA